jgi:hypothetical protein
VNVIDTAASWCDLHDAVYAGGEIGRLYERVVHNVSVETSLGRVYGRDDLVAHAARDQQGLRLQPVRSEAFLGRLGSHRVVVITADIEAEHVGVSAIFGPPTGHRGVLSSTTLALLHEGRVFKAWRFTDYAALAQAFNLALPRLAATLAATRPARGGIPWTFGDVRSALGQVEPPALVPRPPGCDGIVGEQLSVLQSAWNRKRPDLVRACYQAEVEPTSLLQHPWTHIRGACSDGVLFIEQGVIGDTNGDASDVAVVWRWVGTHDGPGFGPPSGHRLHWRGLSVLGVKSRTITGERVLHDALGAYCDVAIRSR